MESRTALVFPSGWINVYPPRYPKAAMRRELRDANWRTDPEDRCRLCSIAIEVLETVAVVPAMKAGALAA